LTKPNQSDQDYQLSDNSGFDPEFRNNYGACTRKCDISSGQPITCSETITHAFTHQEKS